MLTQTEFAKKINVARISVHYYENNKRNPSDKIIEHIQKEFPEYAHLFDDDRLANEDYKIQLLESLQRENKLLRNLNKSLESKLDNLAKA